MATSYSNYGGTGDRRNVATVSTSLATFGVITDIVNGSIDNVVFFQPNAQTVAGAYVRFDMTGLLLASGSSAIIDEAKWYQNNTSAHGTWKWQGSNDGSSWTDIGSSFTLGGVTPFQTQTTLNGNTTTYKFYRLFGVSGTTSNGPWLQEIEFKIDGLIAPAPRAPVIITPITNADQAAKHQIVRAPATTSSTPSGLSPVPVAVVIKGGVLGVGYSETISTAGGTSPYTYSVTSGSLPSGTGLNSSTGVISGVPTATGTYSFTVRSLDAAANSGTQNFSITIITPPTSNFGYMA